MKPFYNLFRILIINDHKKRVPKNLTENNDSAVVERCLEGDKEAFADLVYKYEVPVYNLVYRMVGDREEAKDITQQAFLNAFSSLSSFKRELKFSNWLYKIGTNLCIDYLRKGSQRKKISIEEMMDNSRGEELINKATMENKTQENWDINERVQKAINNLPEHYRAAVVLKHIQDLNYEEASQVLNIPVGTIKTRVHRARKILYEELKDLM